MRTEWKALIFITIAIILNICNVTYIDSVFAFLAICYTTKGAFELMESRNASDEN